MSMGRELRRNLSTNIAIRYLEKQHFIENPNRESRVKNDFGFYEV